MAVKFFTGVDLCNKELLRMKLQLLSASPTEYGEGLLYYNNATSGNLSRRAVIRTNNAWKALAYVSDLESYATASAVNTLTEEVNGIKSSLSSYTPLASYNSLSSKVDGIDGRLEDIEVYFSSAADSDNLINKWHEIVNFLNATEGDTLSGILSLYAKASDLTSAVNRIATLENTLATEQGYIDTLQGYFTNGAAKNAIGDGSGNNIIDTYATKTALNTTNVNVASNTAAISSLNIKMGTLYDWYETVGKFFKYNSTEKAWYLDGDFYTTGQNAAGEAGSASDGSGSGIILNYDAIVEALGYTPAKSTDLSGLTSRVSALESKATSVSYAASTASSAVIGTLTIDGKANDVTLRSANVTSALGYTPTRKFTGTISTTGGTTQTFTHNFNTRDVIVQIFMPSTPWEQVYADVRVSTVNSVAIAFAEAPTMAYQVVIIG